MHRTIKLLFATLGVAATLAGVAAAATSPGVSTGGATSIHDTSAVLNGTINPNGATTYYQFQWGLTKAYGITNRAHSAGAGTKTVAVKTTVSRLIPGTVYHYRVVALSKGGAAFGADRTFKTAGNPPPGAITGPVSALSANSATVTGIINPNNQTTTWFVQYGLTPLLGAQTGPQVIAATKLAQPVSAPLAGLQSGATFYYRLVAEHSNAPAQYGAEATFITYPSPRPRPRVLAKTTPRRDKSRPYTFTTSGRVTTSRSLPASVQCSGNLTARFYNGKRQVGSTLFALGPDCKFSGTTTFRHLPTRRKRVHQVRLTVRISFSGNPYSAPATASAETITLG